MGVFFGTEGPDTLLGSDGTENDTISGLGGDDLLNSSNAFVQQSVGAGNDDIFGGFGSDTIFGGAPLLILSEENSFIEGGFRIFDARAAIVVDDIDDLHGGFGNDLIHGGFGDDHLFGGADFDTLSYARFSLVLSWTIEDSSGPSLTGAIAPGADGLVRTQGVSVDLEAQSATFDGLFGTHVVQDPAIGTGTAIRFQFTGAFEHRVEGFERVFGTQMNDTLLGSDNSETGEIEDFRGGEGDDSINGRGGFDQISFRPGVAGVTVDLGGRTTDEFGDTDILRNIEAVAATNFADRLTGTGANERFRPYAGADIIDGKGGIDTLDFSKDEFLGGLNGVVVNLEDGLVTDSFGDADQVTNVENIVGGRFADAITGDEGDNELSGLGARDTLSGGDGRDVLDGGEGNDRLLGDADRDRLFGGTGRDTLVGGRDGDLLVGGDQNDSLTGGAGKDTLFGGDDNDTADGNGGNDKLEGQAGNDTLRGGDDNDGLEGGTGTDELFGDDGEDALYGGPGFDILNGGAGRDRLFASKGSDSYNGGPGVDALDFNWRDDVTGDLLATGGVQVDLNAQTVRGGGFGTADAKNIEIVFGTPFSDTLTGSAGKEFLSGGKGRDVLAGGDKKDRLHGGEGNDTIRGGDGDDEIEGDRDDGTTGALRGSDELRGGPGKDTIKGGLGGDDIDGGRGKDTIFGDGGRDSINGGDNKDVLFGGSGADVFVTSRGKDVIRDFERGVDTIELTDPALFDFTNFIEINKRMEQIGNDVRINVSDGVLARDTLLIKDIRIEEFSRGDFIWDPIA